MQAGGFAAAAVGVDAPKPKETEAVAALQPVEILAKPNPQYTDEARKLGLEGEVLVQVVFPASGPVQVVRVIKGLGHGLDESAMHAAEQRFVSSRHYKTANRNGFSWPPCTSSFKSHIKVWRPARVAYRFERRDLKSLGFYLDF